jgi:hypothetical protein
MHKEAESVTGTNVIKMRVDKASKEYIAKRKDPLLHSIRLTQLRVKIQRVLVCVQAWRMDLKNRLTFRWPFP